LTDPRNAKREDLFCPFGCREAHRRRESVRRSVAYYRTTAGRRKKRSLNERRALGTTKARPSPGADARGLAEAEGVKAGGVRFDAGVVEHVRVVTSLIEGRRVLRGEVLRMLSRISRQHRIVRMRRLDYVVHELLKRPSG
jgi:hypothetical protein